jgi:hypothetical protein
MDVMGVGLGRTGTFSLKIALEKLGFSPCFHLLDVFRRPTLIQLLVEIGKSDDGDVNWQSLFSKYRAGVDFPFTTHYKELLELYPDIKVILTTRDPDSWYESARRTIYYIQKLLIHGLPWGRAIGRKTIWQRLFHGRFSERAYALEMYAQHVRCVQQVIPPEQLLLFDVRDGWTPLCEFLNVPVPLESFPQANQRNIMYLIIAGMVTVYFIILSAIATLVLTVIFSVLTSA